MGEFGAGVSVRGIVGVFEVLVAVIETDSALFEQAHLLFGEHSGRHVVLPH